MFTSIMRSDAVPVSPATGIERAGAALAEHFPRKHDDKNELSDEIVYGGKLKDRHPR